MGIAPQPQEGDLREWLILVSNVFRCLAERRRFERAQVLICLSPLSCHPLCRLLIALAHID